MSGQITFDEIFPLLEETADTLVLFHRNPDADAIGSAFALKKIMEALGSRAFCVCACEIPSRLRFLMNGEQESVLPEAIPEDFDARRIVSVDCASISQLDRLYPLYEGRIDLMIDHHENDEIYAESAYVRPDAAATGEILFDLVKELARAERLEITEEICTSLYAAISADTGGFRFSNVTPKTHLRAAELTASGIDTAEINRRLFDCKSMEQLRAESAGVSQLELFADGQVAIIGFPYALKAALGLEDAHLETLIDVARSVSGVKLAFCIRQPEAEGRFRVSARSSCAYDVAALCREFNGGGHAKAAGCTVFAGDIVEAREMLLKAIDLSQLEPTN